MFKHIAVTQLAEGMRFSQPLFFDDEKNMFLASGSPLKAQHIAVLKEWNIPFVACEGKILGAQEGLNSRVDPSTPIEELEELEELDASAFIDGSAPPPVAIKLTPNLPFHPRYESVKNLYFKTIKAITKLHLSLSRQELVNTQALNIVVDKLLTCIDEDRPVIARMLFLPAEQGIEYAKRIVDASIICGILAEQLYLSEIDCKKLCRACFLHTIGKIIYEKAQIQKKEDDVPKLLYPLIAQKYVEKTLRYSTEVGIIIAQYAEAWDGSGYPHKLRADAINLSARILSVAHVFAQLVNPKKDQQSLSGYHIMKQLLSENGKRFCPSVIKALIQSIGPYPIGSYVRLNTQHIAVVTKISLSAPLRPQVQLVTQSQNGKNARDILDLQKRKDVFIEASLLSEDIMEGNG